MAKKDSSFVFLPSAKCNLEDRVADGSNLPGEVFQVTTQQTQAPRAIWNIELLTVAHLCIPANHSWRNFTCSKLHFLEKPHLFTWRNFTWTNCTWRHPPSQTNLLQELKLTQPARVTQSRKYFFTYSLSSGSPLSSVARKGSNLSVHEWY